MQVFRPYGVAAKLRIPMIKAGSDDFAVAADWTPATGDVKVSKDGGAIANAGTLPVVISGSGMWEFTLSAAEMEADEITVTVIDSATKAVKDQAFSLTTQIPGALRTRKAQAGAASTITLDAGASATNDLYNNAIVSIIGGTGAGQQRIITGYVGSTKVATVDSAWATNPDSTSIFTILPLGIVGLTQAQVRTSVGLAAANLDAQLGSLATSSALASARTVIDAILVDTDSTIPGLITTVDTVVDSIQADTNDIQARLPAALVGGRIDASVGAMAANTITAAAIATDAIDGDAIAASAVTEMQTGLATAAALATVSSKIDTVDAIVDSILVDTGTDIPGQLAAVAAQTGDIAAVKAKTDQLAFDAGHVTASVKRVGVTTLAGGGAGGQGYGG